MNHRMSPKIGKSILDDEEAQSRPKSEGLFAHADIC